MEKRRNLSLLERVQIKTYLEQDLNPSQIGIKLGRNRSTISRELNKWCEDKDYEKYDPGLADWYSKDGIKTCQLGKNKLKKNPKLLKLVLKKLIKKWSPEQISYWLRKHYRKIKSMRVSHETIYKYIYYFTTGSLRELLIGSLRQGKKKRKSRAGLKTKGSRIKNRVSIDERPAHVEKRNIVGHYESDLIVGKDHKSAIGTIVERKTRYTFIVSLKNKTTEEVVKAFSKVFNKFSKKLKKSMTHDNGLEMADHEKFTKNTGMQVYFCHPYSSWERGSNENTNGLLRQYWPKGTDFNLITKAEIKRVQNELNGRPRRILGFSTPSELFNSYI